MVYSQYGTLAVTWYCSVTARADAACSSVFSSHTGNILGRTHKPTPTLHSKPCFNRNPVSPCAHHAPAQSICFACTEDPTEQGDMPFMVVETKNSRGGGHRLRFDKEDAWDILVGVRGELEVGAGAQ